MHLTGQCVQNVTFAVNLIKLIRVHGKAEREQYIRSHENKSYNPTPAVCQAQSFEMFPENFYTSFTSFTKLGQN